MVPSNDRMLQYRILSGCSIVPAAGHGLGPEWSAEQGSSMLGAVGFETVAVSENGALRFVDYFTGDSGFYTGFGVTVGADANERLERAEVVLASFQIVGDHSPDGSSPRERTPDNEGHCVGHAFGVTALVARRPSRIRRDLQSVSFGPAQD